MATDTLFQPSGGAGGSSSGDYVKDHFLDTSRPATDNTNLTSTASTNPLGFYFNNTDTPTYGVKTLIIKDATLIQDRSKWVNSKPTYEISFTEYNPAIRAYAVGNIRVRNSTKGKCIELRSIGDLFGVTGVINQLAWMTNVSDQATASAATYTDGSAVSTINFNNGASDSVNQGVAKYNLNLHSASASTTDIHDFRLGANQAGGLCAVEGIVAYFSSTDIVCRPGSTYNDKTIITTTTGSTLPLATISGSIGGKSVIYKAATGVYTQSTQEPRQLTSVATGAINTNLLTVTTGHGASFGLGYGVVAYSGSSQYFGIVSNISTDTLTVGPTLAFGISGALYKTFAAGSTYAISSTLYKVKNVLDFYELNNPVQSGVFGATLQGEMYFADPAFSYYSFGKDLQFQTIDGYIGLGFKGNTSAYLQVDGNFAACDIEYMANGIFNATFSINGAPAWGINAGSSGLFRATVFTDGGPGWNSFTMVPGQSHTGIVITKVNLYGLQFPSGLTAGLLTDYQSFATTVTRSAENATIMQLGSNQRLYADQLNLQGGWTRGVSSAFAGNVGYFGGTGNCVMNFQYYGKNFGLIGTEGGSMSLTIDGASIGSAFNVMKGVTTTGWHSLALTYKAGATCVLQALSFEKPRQGELVSLQQKEPRKDLERIPQTFVQSTTPLNSKDGDVWVQVKTNAINQVPTVWMKLFSLWNKFQFAASVDDPQMTQYVTAGGRVTNNAGSVATAELYNGAFWITLPSMASSFNQSTGSDGGYNYGFNLVDGINTAGSVASFHQRFIQTVWATLTNRSTAKSLGTGAAYASFLTANKGTTNGNPGNGQNTLDLWSGSAWSTGTAWANVGVEAMGFVTNNLLSYAGGRNAVPSDVTTHEQKNVSQVNSTNTVLPTAASSRQGTQLNSNLAIVIGAAPSAGGATANSYTWNTAAWSAALTASFSVEPITGNGSGTTSARGSAIAAGGLNSSEIASATAYNGAAFSVITSRAISVAAGSGGTLGVS